MSGMYVDETHFLGNVILFFAFDKGVGVKTSEELCFP